MNKNEKEHDAASELDTKPASDRNLGDDPGDDTKAVAATTEVTQELDPRSLSPQRGPGNTTTPGDSEKSDESHEPTESHPQRLTGNENIPVLLLLLFPAGLRHAIAAIPQRIRFKLISFFGICSMIAPLALWIAPSMKVWLSILAGSLLSILFCWALVWFGPEDHY